MTAWLASLPPETRLLVEVGAVLFALGMLLSWLSYHKVTEQDPTERKISKILPGIQCARCGHVGCESYAHALVAEGERPDLCVPGGPELTAQICAILGVDPPGGASSDDLLFTPRTVAYVVPDTCNGCGKCRKACKVDAILGAPREIHQVDPEECTGCGDCVKICPQKCIEMVRLSATTSNYSWQDGGDAPGRRA
ncbi:MAG: RnfABCDGE type electron transport complex subunit B [Succinivibrionaceae bacterium]|nr:RnfABCDGE type electron transport complex subunit B [Succinivibrionaceae bacterium]